MDYQGIKESDFQRLFRLKGGITYLLSDAFAGYYRRLECLLISYEGTWTSYLPKRVVLETLEDGLDRLSSEKKFAEYASGFDQYKSKAQVFFDTILAKKELNRGEVSQVFDLIAEMFENYSKTEFFYTDKAYMALEISPDKELVHNLELFEELKNSGRQFLNQLIFGGGYLDRIVEILSGQFGVSVDDLKMYKCSEVLDLFEGKHPDTKVLGLRRDSYVQHSLGGEICYLEGDDADKVTKDFYTAQKGDQFELKGVVANRGKVVGRVRVISSDYYSDFSVLAAVFDQMEYGEVLVAETTSPELMPACKKAGAIVTDQGGLLSHAAIVSRELKLPCIVGTNNATEVLKTGDMVEVDADKGVVRKI